MSVINSTPLLMGEDGYQISRSVRLRSSASAYFNRTPASSSNFQINTISFWVKRGSLGSRQALFSWAGVSTANNHSIEFTAANAIEIYSVGTAASMDVLSTQVFRDPSAWYHIVYAIDTTQATAANRVKLYVNGLQVTAFGTATYPTQNANLQINSTNPVNIGRRVDNTGAGVFDGYLTEVNFIDGQALTPSSFGETDAITGVWKPKKYAGTYGTNGFYLNFSDNSNNTAATIGKDYSGNGNNWTPNNISVTSGATYDSMLDTPTPYADGGNGRGNYAVMNPIGKAGTMTLSNGNLTLTGGSDAAQTPSTIGMVSGKWYYEHTITAIGGEQSVGIGTGTSSASSAYVGSTAGQYGYYMNGSKYTNASSSAYGASYTTGDVIGVAYDADAGSLTFYKNGTSQGVAFTGITGTLFALAASRTTSGTNISNLNFGQRPFSYTPPTGFKALNTQNLPDATIKKGNAYFDATTYTGNSTANRSITNAAGFAPDLVWIKDRSVANYHNLFDTARGTGKRLVSNATSAEESNHAYGYLSAFNSDGFAVTNGASGYDNVNLSSDAYVAWQWKESATAGFDIVTYTGNASGAARSVSHNLGVAPKLMITKSRDTDVTGTNHWAVWHGTFVAGDYILLSATNAKANATSYWGNTVPTSSNFFVGGAASNIHNESGKNYVAYLFAEVAGFSKFGSYTGNGSADGPFVYCGFRPRFVLVKKTSATGNWIMYDTARDTYNTMSNVLVSNLSGAEIAGAENIDALSNGFKLKYGGSGDTNTSGATYIFAAFAENPFKNSLAR